MVLLLGRVLRELAVLARVGLPLPLERAAARWPKVLGRVAVLGPVAVLGRRRRVRCVVVRGRALVERRRGALRSRGLLGALRRRSGGLWTVKPT